ncbi:AraC family transcriptional regulator ligand-binding domain-containing protein [Aquabacterium sp. A3]|uniref:AraC family transcriptional regulator n=1 Tax=Aquabacterium sp. A3 TaxID=3132829 RepID=UPI00311A6949
MPSSENESLQAVTVPALFTRSYLALAEEHGHARQQVLRRAGISASRIASGHELSMPEYLCLLSAVGDLLGPEVCIGVEMGWRIPPTALGPLGAAVLSSTTGREALALCRRFWRFYGVGLTLGISTIDSVCTLSFQVQPALVPAAHRHTVLEAMVAGFARGILGLHRGASQYMVIWFDFDKPPWADSVRDRLGNVHWGMPACCIRLPEHLLDTPLPNASALALNDALSQCEQLERLLGKRMDDIAERVRHELVQQVDGYPSFEALAERLHMSTRTLRRRLRDQGVGYMDLLNMARRRDALSLLNRPVLEVAQIAQMLGYADPANFTRAFKQWTGLTPSAWRARLS